MNRKPEQSPARVHGPKQLFGRVDELEVLDRAWASEDETKVLTIIAWGGEGKTSLVAWWRTRLLERCEDVEAVFEWSFYNQGSQERNAVSAESFVREALVFFGDAKLADGPALPRAKAMRLVELIRDRRVVLILDGLDPLQSPPDGTGPGALGP